MVSAEAYLRAYPSSLSVFPKYLSEWCLSNPTVEERGDLHALRLHFRACRRLRVADLADERRAVAAALGFLEASVEAASARVETETDAAEAELERRLQTLITRFGNIMEAKH